MTADVESTYAPIKVAIDADRNGEAIARCKQAIESGIDDAFFLYVLGNCLFKTGDYADSAAALGNSVRLEPNRAAAFHDLAAALFVLGRDADTLGKQAWLDTLAHQSREALIVAFSDSTEFKLKVEPLLDHGFVLA